MKSKCILKTLLILPGLFLILLHVPLSAQAGSDKGQQVVGKVKATLYIGTNGERTQLGVELAEVEEAMARRLRHIKPMNFRHYGKLGSDIQPVFRSYENWLTPLKPSEEILLSYESRGFTADGGLRLDLEFWQQRRKVMKSDPVLHLEKPLLILGPKWRGGTLIIAVELVEKSPPK